VFFESSSSDAAEVVLDFRYPERTTSSGVQHLLACLGEARDAQGAVAGVEAVVQCTIDGEEAVKKTRLQGVLGYPTRGRWVMNSVASGGMMCAVYVC
jgi:hypothetical protein